MITMKELEKVATVNVEVIFFVGSCLVFVQVFGNGSSPTVVCSYIKLLANSHTKMKVCQSYPGNVLSLA